MLVPFRADTEKKHPEGVKRMEPKAAPWEIKSYATIPVRAKQIQNPWRLYLGNNPLRWNIPAFSIGLILL
jgi:hypothetical protein